MSDHDDEHTDHVEGADGHSRHAHGVSANADRRWLTIALALIGVFMCAEVVIGVIANSLALISDAAHMLTDVASIMLALVAMKLAARPAKGMYTYGLKRVEILSAQANGLTLLLLSVWLAYESVHRLISPPDVTGGLVLATALIGIAVNLAATWAISKANRTSMNVEGAYQHILTDLFGFIATAIAGAIVLTTGFARADAIASLLVVVLMLKAGYGLVRDSARVFLEASPAGVDPDALGDRLASQDAVVEIHDLHVWQITSGQNALSAHVLVAPGSDCHQVRRRLQQLVASDYRIDHATLQVDHVGDDANQLHTISGASPATPAGDDHCEDAHGPVHTPHPHEH
ncbi:cobalt-zinc-cadmium efflux system protein [Actinacidiphila yanglinensis]|uniref:Cobalt-zinc-cadmium efflux system protein n=1 Tax=Actinacidiphila yanglinensis TaxID=310779 RepID=A0A1H6E8W4_9ACTN|nr:cation diffusion facilitator family transporter [Actinacidiphila yanglinensis]SEG94147.1 cobalt-zinc-cadmium efflux system protein [Actinacidiphila yanglinensis]